MAEERDWFDDAAFPALLRAARRAYGSAVRGALADAGCDDVPRNGSYVLAAIARTGAPLSQIIQGLGVSKQAAGQLVDTLVIRGYLDRAADPADRRRLTLTLTERGLARPAAIRSAVAAGGRRPGPAGGPGVRRAHQGDARGADREPEHDAEGAEPMTSEPDVSAVPGAERPRSRDVPGLVSRLVGAALVIAALAGLSYAWALGRDPLEIYYAAAVRSMSMSWHNFIYGAFDPAGTVTLDKLPGALLDPGAGGAGASASTPG